MSDTPTGNGHRQFGSHCHCLDGEVERLRRLNEGLTRAAVKVVEEWRIRGDHGCNLAAQDGLRAALAAVDEGRPDD